MKEKLLRNKKNISEYGISQQNQGAENHKSCNSDCKALVNEDSRIRQTDICGDIIKKVSES